MKPASIFFADLGEDAICRFLRCGIIVPMRLRKCLLIVFSLGLAAALTILIIAVIRGSRAPRPVSSGPRLDSIDVHYTLWDSKENRKKLEVWAKESRRGKDGRIHFDQIRGNVYKKGYMTEDMAISAASGITTPDYNDFSLQDQARVTSARLDLRSEYFHLRNMMVVSTDRPAEYSFETMKGKAIGGLEFYFREKDMRFRANEGSFAAGGEEYSHREARCFLSHESLKLNLEEVQYFRSPDSQLKCDRLYLDFASDFSAIKYSLAIDDVFLNRDFSRYGRPGETMALICFSLESFYDETGRMDYSVVKGGAEKAVLDLLKKGRKTMVRAGSMQLDYEAENGRLRSIDGRDCLVEARWRDSFRFSAQKTLLALDDSGEVESIQGEIGCELAWRNQTVNSETASYNGGKNEFILKGDRCELERGKDRFVANLFRIDTKARTLATDSGIQATIQPPAGGQSLFRQRPVFIIAREMVMDERQNRVRFSGDVRLFQDDTELQCLNLEWTAKGEAFDLRARGNATLRGSTAEGKKYQLQGEELFFLSQQNRLLARNGVLRSGEESLSAQEVILLFRAERSLESIQGRGKARFQSRDAEGGAEEVDWNWDESLLHLNRSARIAIKGMSTVRDELTVNLKSNEIVGNPRRRQAD